MAKEHINEEQYFGVVTAYFSFLVTELGFNLSREYTNSSFFMMAEYRRGIELLVSIPYEQGNDYLDIMIFRLDNGREPHYDDLSRNLQLRRITDEILAGVSRNEKVANSKLFSQFHAGTDIEKRLLNAAKAMRLASLHGNLL